MVMWIIVLSLLVIGLILLIVEVIFIPGTTVVGILGVVFSCVAVVISYKHFGSDTGLYVLSSALVLTLAALIYSFKSGAWNRYSLKSSSNSKVNEGMTLSLKTGDEGITVSSLRPVGKAEFDDKIYEVKTFGEYIEPKERVRIIQLESQQIIVEKIQ
jgi:membrane-bound ClpP family serine protease